MPMITTTDFARCLSRFLCEHLPHELNVSKYTIVSYRDAFVQFIDYMGSEKKINVEKLTLKSLTRNNVLEYLNWILDTKKVSPATRNYRLAAIHSFCKYLQYVNIENIAQWQDVMSIRAMRTASSELNYLTKEGVKLLLEQPDRSSRAGRRHLAILALMYDTGARVQEIADLTVDCVRIDSEPYTIKLYGKGRKHRIVPLAENQISILKAYMQEHNLNDINKGAHPLFYNRRGEKLTREGISYVLKTYASMARMLSPELIPGKISCHCIRHSKAMHMLEAGVNLVYIRDILGHVSIQTTNIYARADSKAKREALEKAYANLSPNVSSDKEWEKNKDLREWLKGLGK